MFNMLAHMGGIYTSAAGTNPQLGLFCTIMGVLIVGMLYIAVKVKTGRM